MNYQQFTDQGNSLLKVNKFSEAKLLFEQALELKPDFVDALTSLAIAEHGLGNLNHAVRLYKDAVATDPNSALENENKILSVIYYFSQNNIQEALEILTVLIEQSPEDALLYNMLGGCLASIGQTEMAAANYQKALDLKPEYAIPRHMLNSLTGHTSKEPPKEYVKNLFDDYAHRFNDSLVNNLQYNLPFIIKELILELNKDKSEFNNVIDLGCGTGLAGKNLRDISTNLTGVDVSKNMISEAEKLDIYDKLLVGDIVEELSLMEDKFDLLIALDVLIYVGDVKSIFQAVRKRCKINSLFVFSVEIQESNGYSLLKSSRYAHSDKYIKDQAAELFKLVDSKDVRLRKEGNNWINGKVFVFQPI